MLKSNVQKLTYTLILFLFLVFNVAADGVFDEIIPLPPVGVDNLSVEINGYCEEEIIYKNNIIIGDICDGFSIEVGTNLEGELLPNIYTNITGGLAPYEFYSRNENQELLRHPEGIFPIRNCEGGTYIITVIDANDCQAKDTITLDKFESTADIDYTIEADYIQFSITNRQNIQEPYRLSTTIPGEKNWIDEETVRTSIPKAGTYQFCLKNVNYCEDNNSVCIEVVVDKTTEICRNGIEGDVILGSQAQVDNFKAYYGCVDCTVVNGNLRLSGDDITDLSGLNFLTKIKGNLELEKCRNLSSLNGLDNIEHIGGNLKISNMDNLATLEGIHSSKNIWYLNSLLIRGNDNLTDISALYGLFAIDGNLLIGKNPKLKSLAGLSVLEYVGQRIEIVNNESLSDGRALGGLYRNGNIEGIISMSNNKSGCNNPVQILKSSNLYPPACDNRLYFTDRIEDNEGTFVVPFSLETLQYDRFLWKFGDGTFALHASPGYTHTYAQAGNYSVNLKAIGDCVTGGTKTVYIPTTKEAENTLAKCSDGIDNDGDGLVDRKDIADCACLKGTDFTPSFDFTIQNNIITFENTSTGNYKWHSFSGDLDIGSNKQATISKSGSYTICMAMGNDCDAKRTYCQTISIGSACDDLIIPSQMRMAAVSSPITKKKDILQTLGSVRPNPTVGDLIVDFELPTSTEVSVQLNSISGQQMKIYLTKVSYEKGSHQLAMSLANLPSGIYFLQMQTKEALWVEKISKIDY